MKKQPQEDYSVKEAARQLAQDRAKSSNQAAARASFFRESQTPYQQVSPDPTPSHKTGSWENPNGKLSEPVRNQLGIQPEPEQGKPKSSLEDVKNIRQSLQAQGVTTNEVSTQESKANIENSFDKNTQKSSSNSQEKSQSETEKVRQQAKQDVERQPDKSQSQQQQKER